jgi:hypothetical protein
MAQPLFRQGWWSIATRRRQQSNFALPSGSTLRAPEPPRQAASVWSFPHQYGPSPTATAAP